MICPRHGIPDCSPLLNGCSLPNMLQTQYESGHEDGFNDGYDEGFEDGKLNADGKTFMTVMDPANATSSVTFTATATTGGGKP